jgi:hypothetical protein
MKRVPITPTRLSHENTDSDILYFTNGQCHAYAHALVEANPGWEYAIIEIRAYSDDHLYDAPHVLAITPQERLYDATGERDLDEVCDFYLANLEDDEQDDHYAAIDTRQSWTELVEALEPFGYKTADHQRAAKTIRTSKQTTRMRTSSTSSLKA